jgi:hypothetical protein
VAGWVSISIDFDWTRGIGGASQHLGAYVPTVSGSGTQIIPALDWLTGWTAGQFIARTVPCTAVLWRIAVGNRKISPILASPPPWVRDLVTNRVVHLSH